MSLKIYHNPRCSKSRQTLELIQQQGLEPEIIEYLNHPPSQTELDQILNMLDMQPLALMRKGESEFKEHFKDQQLSRSKTIALMCQYPKVIERPIVVHGDKAAIGRPPESVLDIL